nr:reverse transcriptase domain-containing protein [Tanacetum cinerariifolium]
MRTRSKSYPINSNATIPRRSNKRRVPNIVEPEIRTIEEIVPMVDRTMEELLQAPTEGYGEAIVILEILAENFEIKTNLLQDVLNDAIKLMLFPYSLEGAARIWDSASKTDDRIDKLAYQISNLVEIVNKQVITPATAKAVEKTCVIYGGAHAYYDCIATDSNQPSVCAATGSYNQVSLSNRASHQIPPPGFAPMQNNPNSMQNQINVLRGDFNKQEENLKRNLNDDMRSILGNFFQNQASTSGTLLSNIVPNPKGEMKVVTTCSGLAYEGPPIPTNSPLEKVVERDTEETTEKEHSNCQRNTAHIQPLKLHEKATNQIEKFFQIFHDLHFDISFVDALHLMPKFASIIKSLLTNKNKLFELAKVPLNENCSAMLLKKLPEKLRDPGKFLIPCDFHRIDVCHALANLGASINLMPLSIWKKLSLSELTPTRMTLELADRSITRPKRVAEDVFVKVRKFHFPTDFVVVDFEADPRVPLILGRSFLRTGRALIDVYGEEITLRVNDKSGDILYLEKLLNEDPFQLLPMDLKQAKETKAKSSIEEPLELELKELPSHLEYAFLEELYKLPRHIGEDAIMSPMDREYSTEKLMNEIGELRAISGHVLGAAGVQIPQNNLNNLQSIKEEKDGATEVSDPEMYRVSFCFDPLVLVEGFTPVELNKGLLVTLGMLFDDAAVSANQTPRWENDSGKLGAAPDLLKDDELSDKELKQIEADDQAIQTILLGLPEDIYATEKKAKLFNEWERFTFNEGESIESYYHRFLKLMNDLKRNKHFPEKIASNLKFLNNLQPEWSRHVTIVHQTKDLHTADYTQLYDFLKYNQKEVDELKAERLAKIQDPLALMENSNNPYAFSAPHQDQSSLKQNYLQQSIQNIEDITDPTTAMNMALALMAKAFKLNYPTPMICV